MGSRGATRPMMNMEQHSDKEMSMDDQKEMLHHHHIQTLWGY